MWDGGPRLSDLGFNNGGQTCRLPRCNVKIFQFLGREISQIPHFPAGLFRDAFLETLSGDYQVFTRRNSPELIVGNNLIAIEREPKSRLSRRQKNRDWKMMWVKIRQRLCYWARRKRFVQWLGAEA